MSWKCLGRGGGKVNELSVIVQQGLVNDRRRSTHCVEGSWFFVDVPQFQV